MIATNLYWPGECKRTKIWQTGACSSVEKHAVFGWGLSLAICQVSKIALCGLGSGQNVFTSEWELVLFETGLDYSSTHVVKVSSWSQFGVSTKEWTSYKGDYSMHLWGSILIWSCRYCLFLFMFYHIIAWAFHLAYPITGHISTVIFMKACFFQLLPGSLGLIHAFVLHFWKNRMYKAKGLLLCVSYKLNVGFYNQHNWHMASSV